MRCKNCRKKIEKNSSFCQYCGCDQSLESVGKKCWRLLLSLLILAVCCALPGTVYLKRKLGEEDYIGTEKGAGLTEEEAEELLFSDISDDDWAIFHETVEKLSEIVSQYSNEDGYIESGNESQVINAVAGKVEEYYEDGIIVYYLCDEDGISFEYASGLTAFYSPSHEGDASGYGDISLLTFDPFENDPGNGTMTNTAYQSGNYINEALDVNKFMHLENEEVFPFLLESLPASDFLLWNGHGAYVSHYGEKYPVLLTGEKVTGIGLSLTVDEAVCAVNNVNYWAITPYFVKSYISLDEGLIYLSSCQSGRNDGLADAFSSKGAEVVFVNVGENNVNTAYTQKMMEQIIRCMSAEWDGIFHTAGEALELAAHLIDTAIKERGGVTVDDVTYTSFDSWTNAVQGDTHVEIRGAEAYTLCSCIRGTIESYTETNISEVSGTLSVRLEDENGNFITSTGLQKDTEFYFNNLEPGTYYVSLYQDEELISLRTETLVNAHRYTPVILPYRKPVSLEGHVYDTEGNPLSGVSIAAEITAEPALFPVSAVTDENGYYSIKVYGHTNYTAVYSLADYDSEEIEIEVTSEMYENAQKGIPAELEDVILSKQGVPEEIYASQVIKFMKGDPWTEKEDAQSASDALGGPDYRDKKNSLTLGGSGMLIVSFDETFTDIDGADITIYEVGPDRESVEVAVSADCETWYIVGVAIGGTSGIDMNGYVPEGLEFQYVRVIDLETAPDSDWPGADIDAIGVNVLR